jgi:IclR family pca regulon transcriptional regulator
MTYIYDERNHILGLEKGLAVIECFDDNRQKLTISDAAKAVGLSRAAARRCLLTLNYLGYTDYDGKFFSLTPRTMRLGYAYLASTTIPQILQTYLENLCEEVSEACSAAILDGNEFVYVARAAVKRILAANVNVGKRLPIFCTSLGRVLLSGLDGDHAQKLLESIPRPAFTNYTKTDIEQIKMELVKVRADGYCLVEEELQLGLSSIAVPVFNSTGRMVAAMCISSQPARKSSQQMLEEFLPKLLRTQKLLSSIL